MRTRKATHRTRLDLMPFAADFARMERRLSCCFAAAPDVDDDCVPRTVVRDRLRACRADFDRMATVMQRMLAN